MKWRGKNDLPQDDTDSSEVNREKQDFAVPYSTYIVLPKHKFQGAEPLQALTSEIESEVEKYTVLPKVSNALDYSDSSSETELSDWEDEYAYYDYHDEHSFECKYLKDEKIHLMNLISDFHHSYDDNEDYIVKLPPSVEILNQVKVNDKEEIIKSPLIMAVIQNNANLCCECISKYLIVLTMLNLLNMY